MISLLVCRQDCLEIFRSIFVPHFLLSSTLTKTSMKYHCSIVLCIHSLRDMNDMNGRRASEQSHHFVFSCQRQVTLLMEKINTLKLSHYIYKANTSLIIALCLLSQVFNFFSFPHLRHFSCQLLIFNYFPCFTGELLCFPFTFPQDISTKWRVLVLHSQRGILKGHLCCL